MVGSGNPFTLPTVHHDSLVRDSKMYLSSMALLPRSSEEERDSLTQPLPGSRTDNQSRKAANSRSSLKIPTLSPLSSPTATNKMSVPTPARLTTNSVKLSIPPRSSLKSPPRSKKDLDGTVGWSFFDLGGDFNDDLGGIESFTELVVSLAGVGTDILLVAVGDDKGDKVGIFKDNLEFAAFLDWLSVLEPGNGWVRESLYSSEDLGSRAIDERYILESLTKESWWTVSSQLLADNVSTEGLLYHWGSLNDGWVFKVNSELLWHDYGFY